MTSDKPSGSTTPKKHTEELSKLLRNHTGVNNVSGNADESGAIVTCYVSLDHANDIEELAVNSGFDVVHEHEVAEERHYMFGYNSDKTETKREK